MNIVRWKNPIRFHKSRIFDSQHFVSSLFLETPSTMTIDQEWIGEWGSKAPAASPPLEWSRYTAPPVNSVGHSASVIKFNLYLCYNSKEGEGENEAPFSKPDAPGCT